MLNSKRAIFIGLALLTTIAQAESELNKRLKSGIAKVLPGIEVTSIAPGPVAGIYEVMLGPSVLYMSEDARFVIKGDVFDLDSLNNLTALRRASARVEAFDALGAENMIEFKPSKSETKRTLYVYTDIDCGYCRKMHQEVQQLNDAGIAVRYLAYPRTGLNGESYDKAVSVWCADDQRGALTAAKAGKALKGAACKNPVGDHYRMGEAMGVRGTPAVYSDRGESMGGYVPAPDLIRRLIPTQG